MKLKYRECNTCFTTENFPGIVIDEDGICNLCRQYKPDINDIPSIKELGIDALTEIGAQIHKSASSGADYDAIIGASGGLDSTYVIYLAACRRSQT